MHFMSVSLKHVHLSLYRFHGVVLMICDVTGFAQNNRNCQETFGFIHRFHILVFVFLVTWCCFGLPRFRSHHGRLGRVRVKHHKYPSARGSTGSDKAIKQILKTVLETSPAANINVLFDWSQTPNMFKSGEGKAAAPGQSDKRGEKQGD